MNPASNNYKYIVLHSNGGLWRDSKGLVMGMLYRSDWTLPDGYKLTCESDQIIHIKDVPEYWDKIKLEDLKQLYKQLV